MVFLIPARFFMLIKPPILVLKLLIGPFVVSRVVYTYNILAIINAYLLLGVGEGGVLIGHRKKGCSQFGFTMGRSFATIGVWIKP